MKTAAALLPCLLAPMLGLVLPAVCTSAADRPIESPKADFATLDALLASGDYVGAIAVADTIAVAVRPKPRADDFLARSIDLIKVLIRRGTAELRLGRINAAEANFAEAHRTFKDPDFRRLIVIATRNAGPRLPPAVVDLELAWLDLLFLRETVVIDALRAEATQLAAEIPGSPEQERELRERIEKRLDDLKGLRKAAVEARQSFGERFNAASGVVPASPYAWSLAGPFRETLLDGLAALEQSRLPVAVLPVDTGKAGKKDASATKAADGAGDGRSDLLAIAIERMAAAAEAFDGIVKAVTPKGGGLRPEVRADLALLEAEFLMARARARIESGEPVAARKDVDKVLDLQREAGVLRKNPTPDSHPDLAQPLLFAADLGIRESQRLLADGVVDAAKAEAEESQRQLDRTEALITDPAHPLHGLLAALRRRLASNLQSIGESIPRSDALDAAARRLIRTLDEAPFPPGSDGRQRPAGPPANQDSGGRSPDSATRST